MKNMRRRWIGFAAGFALVGGCTAPEESAQEDAEATTGIGEGDTGYTEMTQSMTAGIPDDLSEAAQGARADAKVQADGEAN